MKKKLLHLLRTSKLCATGGFKLNKWVSNSRASILSIPEEDRAKEIKDLDFEDVLPVERALGVQWCLETDSFRFKIQLPEKTLTRCGILSLKSSVYDPLGMVAPVILPARQILQELCRLKLDGTRRFLKIWNKHGRIGWET